MKVFAVIWGSASYDSYDNVVKAFDGVHGLYLTVDSAKKALEACKQEFIEEVTLNPDYDEEDIISFYHNLETYGSIDEGWFELCYEYADAPTEIHMQIVEKDIEN